MIVSTVSVGSIATILTATIMNVALPDIMGAFGLGQDKAQWVSTGFLAATTSAMLLCDWSIRRLGQRNIYILAILLFVAGSVMGGVATNFETLVIGRILQGAAAGITQPLAMLAMFQVFPPNERGRAMGIYGLAIILAPAVGPYVGGIIVDQFSWRIVFFVPVPFSLFSILLAAFFLSPRNPEEEVPAFDWIGITLLVTAIVSLLVGLSNGTREGWYSDLILTYFIIGIVASAAFVAWELVAPQPLLNLKLFANARFVAAATVSFVFGAGLFASIYLVPLFVQLVQGYSPTRSGLMQLPAGIAMAIAFPLVGRLSDRGGMHIWTVVGMLMIGYSLILMVGAHVNTTFWVFAWWMILNRVGLSLVFPPLSAASIQVLPRELVSQGSGAVNFFRSLGGAFGVNIVAVYVDMQTVGYRESLSNTQIAGNSTTVELMETLRRMFDQLGLDDSLQEPSALIYLGRMIAHQADMFAYRDGFLLMAVVTLAAVIPGWFIRQRPNKPAI